ncbi:MAG: hypothetical protein ACW9W3_03295 [Candidatus Nitrosopumilus sp. bin_68KS]
MSEKSPISDEISKEIIKKTKRYTKQLETEKDEVKQADIFRKILIIQQKVLMKKIHELSEKDFQQLIEDMSKPANQTLDEFSSKLEKIAYKKFDTPEKFDTFRDIQDIKEQLGYDIIDVLDQANMNKRDLERYLSIILISAGEQEIQKQAAELELFELYSGIEVIQKRLGYDHRWLIGMSLLQLYENLIKKKLSELKFKINKEHKMPFLIQELVKVIEEKEGRNIKLKIEMSQGLKQLRDKLTHAGYKYSISKDDLILILDEVKKLERTLYPEQK